MHIYYVSKILFVSVMFVYSSCAMELADQPHIRAQSTFHIHLIPDKGFDCTKISEYFSGKVKLQKGIDTYIAVKQSYSDGSIVTNGININKTMLDTIYTNNHMVWYDKDIVLGWCTVEAFKSLMNDSSDIVLNRYVANTVDNTYVESVNQPSSWMGRVMIGMIIAVPIALIYWFAYKK